MADEDLKYSLNIIEQLKDGLKNTLKASNVGNEKNHEDLVNKFVNATKTYYASSQDPDRKKFMEPEENMKMLYQNIGEDFKDLVNKLSLDQKQKDEATQVVAKYTNIALESTGFLPLKLPSAGKIIAEDVHKNYEEVVDSLPMTNKHQMDAQAKYKTDVERVISDPKRGNILDEIATLNAKLQKDLNLNDRQVNELNIGVGHYIEQHRSNFAADLKNNMSREDITKYLNEKTAASYQTLSQTRAQAAKSAVIDAGKRATTISSAVKNTPAKVKKIFTQPTNIEIVYDTVVKRAENKANAKWKEIKQDARAKVNNAKSTVSHKMPPEAKEFATKIGHDALEKANAAVELAKSAKNTVKTFVKDTWKGR